MLFGVLNKRNKFYYDSKLIRLHLQVLEPPQLYFSLSHSFCTLSMFLQLSNCKSMIPARNNGSHPHHYILYIYILVNLILLQLQCYIWSCTLNKLDFPCFALKNPLVALNHDIYACMPNDFKIFKAFSVQSFKQDEQFAYCGQSTIFRLTGSKFWNESSSNLHSNKHSCLWFAYCHSNFMQLWKRLRSLQLPFMRAETRGSLYCCLLNYQTKLKTTLH